MGKYQRYGKNEKKIQFFSFLLMCFIFLVLSIAALTGIRFLRSWVVSVQEEEVSAAAEKTGDSGENSKAEGTEEYDIDTDTLVGEYGGHTYQLFEENLSWKDAQAACEEMGGHLVFIENQEESVFVNELVANGTRVFYWLGGTDEGYSVNDFHWTNGETLNYSNWADGQPDNGYLNEEYEHYIGMVRTTTPYMSREYTWNDYRNMPNDEHGYICEWD